MITSRRLASALVVAYACVVAFIVFLPSEAVASGSVNLIWKLLHAVGAPSLVAPAVVEFVANVVLFMPLTLLARSSRVGDGGAGCSPGSQRRRSSS